MEVTTKALEVDAASQRSMKTEERGGQGTESWRVPILKGRK